MKELIKIGSVRSDMGDMILEKGETLDFITGMQQRGCCVGFVLWRLAIRHCLSAIRWHRPWTMDYATQVQPSIP